MGTPQGTPFGGVVTQLHKRDFSKNANVNWSKLVDEMMAQIKQTDEDISKEILLMIAKLVVIDPKNKFLLRQPAVPLEMERLRKLTIGKCRRMSKVNRNTLGMQLHYREKSRWRDIMLDEIHKSIVEKISDLMQDLVNSVPKRKRFFELYFQKLVAATIIHSRMGSTTDLSVIKETEVALRSIFSKDNINTLHSIPHKERGAEITLTMLTTAGVRLYNMEMDPHLGAGIDNFTKTLSPKINQIVERCNDLRLRSIKRVIRYTTAIKQYFMEVQIYNRNGRRDVASHMIWIRQGLVMVHQLLIYIKELSEELMVEDANCSYLNIAYNKTMEDLKTTTKDQSSLPTHIVTPKFVELAEIWDKLSDAKAFVDEIGDLVTALDEYTEVALIEMDPIVNRILGNAKVPHEKDFFDYPQYNLPVDTKALARKKDFKPEMDALSMEYCGFCVYSLVKGMGLVLLPNPHLGVYFWQGREYMVSSPEGAIEFRRDPSQFVDKIVHFARRWPTLIYLLRMDKEAFNFNVVGDGDINNVAATALVTKQMETQTDIHPMETNIVEGYSWNEFELRRKAIILSKIHKCATHGTQTHWQALNKNENTQTYYHKNQQVQTMTDVSTSLPMNQFFLYGLRGYNCGIPPHVIELVAENAQDYSCKCSTKVKKEKEHNRKK